MTGTARYSPPHLGDERLFQVARRHGCSEVVRVRLTGPGADISAYSVPPRLEHGAQGVATLQEEAPWVPAAEGSFPLPAERLADALLLVEVGVDQPDLRDRIRALRPALQDARVALLVGSAEEPMEGARLLEDALPDFRRTLASAGVSAEFTGRTGRFGRGPAEGLVAIVRPASPWPARTPGAAAGPPPPAVPDTFKVAAIVVAYNEADIIAASLQKLIDHGIQPYLVDNWSTDATAERAAPLLGKGLLGIEKFPVDGPPQYYEWERLLGRMEELSRSLECDWIIHHDADQFRLTPWGSGVTLREGIWRVDAEGYNAIDFTLLDFPPVDNSYEEGADPEARFRHFTPTPSFGVLANVTAWKRTDAPVNLRRSAGHQAEFEGRRVYPYNFLLRHVPIRSQQHGERKVFQERKKRFLPEEREEKGWHIHYDHVETGHSFLADPATLSFYDELSFADDYVMERLYGFDVPTPVLAYLQWLLATQDGHVRSLDDHVRALDAARQTLEQQLAQMHERSLTAEARLHAVEQNPAYRAWRRVATVVGRSPRAARAARRVLGRVQRQGG